VKREHFCIPPTIRRQKSREFGQNRPDQKPEKFNVKDHVFPKPNKEKPRESLIIPEVGKITLMQEVHEACDTQGNLGVVMEFSGIEFADVPVFKKSRTDYKQNKSVYYSGIKYRNRPAYLVLITTSENVLESQIVPAKIDKDAFFTNEIPLPQLTVTHDPASMTVYGNNNLIVVSYQKL